MIAEGIRWAGPYFTDGVQTVFDFDFKVLREDTVAVLLVSAGVETALVYGSGFTVQLNGNQDVDPGGTITLTTDPLTSGPILFITSDTAVEQPAVFTNRGNFYPRVLNDSLDRLTIYIQELWARVSRTFVTPVGEDGMTLPPADEREGKYLGFGAGGAPVLFDPAGAPFMVDTNAQLGDGVVDARTIDGDPNALADIRRKLGYPAAFVWGKPLDLINDADLVYAPGGVDPDEKRVSEGDVLAAGVYKYVVLADDAVGVFIETPSGVRIRPVPTEDGAIVSLMFGVEAGGDAGVNTDAFLLCRDLCAASGIVQVTPAGTYDFNGTLAYPGGMVTSWDSVLLLQQFDGEGVIFGSNAQYCYTHGFLRVQKGAGGSGPVPNDGNAATGAGTVSGDHAVVFKGRNFQTGCVDGQYTQDSAIILEASANANHSRFAQIRGLRCGKYGIEARGTQDDNSLWIIHSSSYGNWDGGMHLPDDYPARSWLGLIHCEANCRKGSGVEFYAGSMTLIEGLSIYAENSNPGINEIEFGPNCEWINYYDYRNNKTVYNSTRNETINNYSRRTGRASPVIGGVNRATWVRSGGQMSRYARHLVTETAVGGSPVTVGEWRLKGDRWSAVVETGGNLTEQFEIRGDGNAGIVRAGKSLYLRSPNGTVWYLTVDNSGVLTTTTTVP